MSLLPQQLLEQLIKELKAQRLRVYTVESITAGGIAAHLASVAGSSAWLYGGIICYNEEIKRDLGVTAVDIYTPECARQMAECAALNLNKKYDDSPSEIKKIIINLTDDYGLTGLVKDCFSMRNDIVILAVTGRVFGESDIAVWYKGVVSNYHLNTITDNSSISNDIGNVNRVQYQARVRDIALAYLCSVIKGESYTQ